MSRPRRSVLMKRTTIQLILTLLISISAFAQQATTPERRGPQPIPLFFRGNLERHRGHTGHAGGRGESGSGAENLRSHEGRHDH